MKRIRSKKAKFYYFVLFVAITLSAILLSEVAVSFSLINFKMIGEDNIDVTVNDEFYDYGYIVNFRDKEYNKVVTENNVNTGKVGEYEVNYILPFGIFNRTYTRRVNVVDNEEPVIELKDNDYIYLRVGMEYQEAGYTATDNVDGDITNNVLVSGNVDINAPGVYEISYDVSDSSSNKAHKVRKVEVLNNNPLTMSVEEYSLEHYFEKVTLKPDDVEYDYLKDAILLGDSNTTYLYFHGKYMPAEQIWGANGLNVAQMKNSSFMTFGNGQIVNFKTAMSGVDPKYLILNVGITCVEYMSEEQFKTALREFIEMMNSDYSNIRLIITTLLPIHEGSYEASVQKKINEFNYYIGEMCEEYNILFVNFADGVKDESGLADRNLFECQGAINCGFHLNEQGKRMYVDFLKHLNLEKEI